MGMGGAGVPGGATGLPASGGPKAATVAQAAGEAAPGAAAGSAAAAAELSGALGRGLPAPALQAGVPVYNLVDGHFYGTTHQGGQRGSLWRLKPDTNTVDVLLRFNGRALAQAAEAGRARPPAATGAETRQQAGRQGAWLSNPLISDDGRRLYLVADLGGRFLRGVVMQVDIDPASPKQGQADTVFTFADQDLPDEHGCADPAARTGYQLAWGAEEGAGRQLLLSRSRLPAAAAVLPGGVLPEPTHTDTSACSLALLPRPGAASSPAWDMAEAVREAAPWPTPLPSTTRSQPLASAIDRAATAAADWPATVWASDGAARFQVSVAPAWAGQPLALMKRDLATGATDRLPLELAGAALQAQPWLTLPGGESLARVSRAPAGASGARRGSVGGLIETETPGQGLALVDTATGRISRLAGHRAAMQSAQSLLQLHDGTVWDVRLEAGQSGSAWRTVYRIDPRSLAATPVLSLADAGPAHATSAAALAAGQAEPSAGYMVAGRGQALYLGTHAPASARRAGAQRQPSARPLALRAPGTQAGPLRLSCLRTDLPGQVLSHVPLPSLSGDRAPATEPLSLVGGPTHAPAHNALYMAVLQHGRDGAPDTAALLEVDRGLPNDALCRRAPQVVTLVEGLTDVPVTGLLATRDGRLVYASRSGRLMQLDPARRRVQALADLRTAVAGQRQWVADLAEVAPGRLGAWVQAQDGRGRPLGRHLVQVALGSAGGAGASPGSAAMTAIVPAVRVSQAN